MFSNLRTDYNQYLKRLRAMLKNYVISASIYNFYIVYLTRLH